MQWLKSMCESLQSTIAQGLGYRKNRGCVTDREVVSCKPPILRTEYSVLRTQPPRYRQRNLSTDGMFQRLHTPEARSFQSLAPRPFALSPSQPSDLYETVIFRYHSRRNRGDAV